MTSGIRGCSGTTFLSRICVARNGCSALITILGGGGGVVLRNTPNINGAFTTGHLTCSVVNRGSRNHVRFMRFRRGCSCRSFVVNCGPIGSNFRLGCNVFCHFYRGTTGRPSGSFFFVVSRVGHNGVDGVFNRLLVLVRQSCEKAGTALTCGNVAFSIPGGLCVVNVVGATSQDLTVVSCTLHHHFDFFSVRPKFSSTNFVGCRRKLGGRAFSLLMSGIRRLGGRVTLSGSLKGNFYVNRDCFYNRVRYASR